MVSELEKRFWSIRFTIPRLVILVVLSYLAGLGAYLQALHTVWHQSISQGDLVAVTIDGLIAYTVFGVPVYIGVFRITELLLERYWGWRRLPVLVSLALTLPVAVLITLVVFGLASFGHFGAGGTMLVSPEAQLFYAFFLTSGLVFSLGWRFVKKSD